MEGQRAVRHGNGGGERQMPGYMAPQRAVVRLAVETQRLGFLVCRQGHRLGAHLGRHALALSISFESHVRRAKLCES